MKERTRQHTCPEGSLEGNRREDMHALISFGFCLVASVKQGVYHRSEVDRSVSPGALGEGFLRGVGCKPGPK